jgi:hypothetical protein
MVKLKAVINNHDINLRQYFGLHLHNLLVTLHVKIRMKESQD